MQPFNAERVLIDADPFPLDLQKMPWSDRGLWPCHWVHVPNAPTPPFISAFRLKFHLNQQTTLRLHVTADERYELYADGHYVGRGSERGDKENWYFESYDLTLEAGDHILVARVWSLGELAAFAQMSSKPGFLLCPDTESQRPLLATGQANWEATTLPGYEFVNPLAAWGTGHNLLVDGRKVAWGWEQGSGDTWAPTEKGLAGMAEGANDRTPSHVLKAATLPPMLERPWQGAKVRHVSSPPPGPTSPHPILAQHDLHGEHANWQSLLEGSPLTLEPKTRTRVLIDLNDYVCAYPRLQLTGGKDADVRILWQEALYESLDGPEKGNRDQVEGKFFRVIWAKDDGVGDRFISDGGLARTYDTLWWQAGRYVELLVETAEDPLTIESLVFAETHYPYQFEAEFESEDPRLQQILPILKRVLEMCSHETYMDCPYYEQLQYIGDTRLQVLVTYVLTNDDRLPRKALRMFDASRLHSGLTQSRYPSRVRQIIPPFSLWWVAMIHDFALWRGDMEFVAELMPGARAVLDAYRAQIKDGLLGPVDGWNFVDWVPGWEGGMPKDGSAGVSGILNLQLAYVLKLAADLEQWLEEPELAARHRRTAEEIIGGVNRHFWTEEKGLYANDLAHAEFSEHAQCLAFLADAIPEYRKDRVTQALLKTPDLQRVTIYFSHYLFETYRLLDHTDLILERMTLWFDHPANGLKTTIEMPEPTRSDCHAWGAHPAFHFFATFLGIRPTAPGFRQVTIEPKLQVSATLPTPLGHLKVEASANATSIHAPDGMIIN